MQKTIVFFINVAQMRLSSDEDELSRSDELILKQEVEKGFWNSKRDATLQVRKQNCPKGCLGEARNPPNPSKSLIFEDFHRLTPMFFEFGGPKK